MRKLIFIYAFFICCCEVLAQQYNFINYNIQDGLTNAQVNKLHADHKGYLWIAMNGGGLSRFDGSTFEHYGIKTGLPSNVIYSIHEDAQNQKWIGTQKGLLLFNDGTPKSIFLKERSIHSICQGKKNTLWIGTDKGLYHLDLQTQKAQKHRLDSKLNIAQIHDLLPIGKSVWIASSKGLFVLNENKMAILNDRLAKLVIKSFAQDKFNDLWAAIPGQGVISIASKSKRIQKEYNSTDLQDANEICIDKEGHVWVGTINRGVLLLQKGKSTWSRISESQGLSNNHVQSIIQDGWDNIWIGTLGGGFDKFLGQYFSYYNSDTGLNGNRIYAVTEDTRGTLWLGIDNKGVTTIDSLGIHTDIDGDYINSKVNHIIEDMDGKMWLSTAGGGLVMKDSNEYWVFNELDGLPSSWISTAVQDTAEAIWVGTYADGIAKIVFEDSIGIQAELFGMEAGMPDLFVTVMASDPYGKIWFGTKQGGLGYIIQDSIYAFENSTFPIAEISCFAFDENGAIWLGVVGYGLFYSQSAGTTIQFKRATISQSLSSQKINQLIFDQEGHLWVGTNMGLDKILFDKTEIAGVQHFGRNEGFLGVETSPRAIVQDRNGHLWFGTSNGLSKHIPGNTQLEVAPPNIHFTGVNLMYKPLQETSYAHYLTSGDSLASKSTFKHNQNNIGFRFQGVNIDYPEDLTYSWKLNGFDDSWSPTSSSEIVNYTNLSPGKYQFLAKAINQSGLESEIISTSFEISPALWQSIWFQAACLLCLAVLTYLIVQNRINKIRKREKERRAQLELENELLGLEQKALQLQMNPHFIFNALNSIQSVVVTQKTDLARDQIQNFAGLMRGILNSSKKQTITLKEEYDTIDKYLKLEQFCQTTAFDFGVTLPKEYDPEEIEIPPMMIQPFVENAVIHGVTHLKQKGCIIVNFEIENELLSCTITDNGVGREKAASLRNNKSGHQSVAIDVTRKRLESLRGQQNYTAFSVADVRNAQGGVGGTKVTIKMPLKLTF